MSKFKPGDRVRCINSAGSLDQLTVNQIYTIHCVYSCPMTKQTLVNFKSGGDGFYATRFELVEETPVKREFKVGDRVRRCAPDSGFDTSYVKQGAHYTIAETTGNSIQVLGNPQTPQWYSVEYFELVEEYSELKELVDKANAGLKALNALGTKRFEIEVYNLMSGKPTISQFDDLFSELSRRVPHFVDGREALRIKPKPKKTFREFTTSNGWKVKLEGDFGVKIGCRTFDLALLKTGLDNVINRNATNSNDFMPTKLGVIYLEGSNVLAWTDAEQLLARLKEIE